MRGGGDRLNNRGVADFEGGRPDEARKAWSEALREDPLHPEATFNFCMAEWFAGRLAEDDVFERLADVRAHTGEHARCDHLIGLVRQDPLLPPPGDGSAPRCLRVLPGTRSHVMHAALPPDLGTAFAFDSSGVLASWELTTGKLLAAHATDLEPIALARSGLCAIGVSYAHDEATEDDPRRMAVVWAVDRSGARTRLFARRIPGWFSGALDHAGTLALCIHDRGGQLLVDTATGRVRWSRPSPSWEHHGTYCHGSAITPDGRFAIARNEVIDVASGNTVHELGDWQVSAVATSADCRFALVGRDKQIELWELASGRQVRVFENPGHVDTVADLAFDATGDLAVSSGQDGLVCLWDVRSGRRITRFLDNHGIMTAVAISRCGRFAISGGAERVTRLYDLGRSAPRTWTPEVARAPSEPETSAAAARFDTALDAARGALALGQPRQAVAELERALAVPLHARDPAARAFKAQLGAVIRRGAIRGLYGSMRAYSGNHVSDTWRLVSDGRFLAIGTSVGNVSVFDLVTGTRVLVQKAGDDCAELAFAAVRDVHRLLIAADGRIRAYDLIAEDSTIAVEHGSEAIGTVIALSAQYALVASRPDACDKLSVLRIDEGGKPHLSRELVLPANAYRAAIADRAGRLICRRGNEGFVDVYSLGSGERIASSEHPGLNSLAISRDGTRAVIGMYDGLARVWDIERGAELVALDHNDLGGLRHNVHAVAFSPDGLHVATGGADRVVAIWEVATGRRLTTIAMHRNEVAALAWTPDSSRVVSASEDGTVRVHELDWELLPD